MGVLEWWNGPSLFWKGVKDGNGYGFQEGWEGRKAIQKKWTVPKSVLEQELRESRVTSRLSPRARAFHTIPAPEIYLHH